ncbi:MAG TPA: thioredoxin family protein [Flavobacterium sp.]|uniref:thioredoxin family protein n=1 Tax=Flavobacterium sp. TaxID=239 RepID=UPI002DBBE283|nr:thioredoxin family protein [Flavobacterium sp.]HEU4790086.1 thioredoxin family protein [Flavobacterium sp.]
MKTSTKHNFIIVFLFFVSIAKAQKTAINFIENDYKLALEQSKTSKKPIFVMVYATWCPHCNKMKSTVLKDPTVVDFFNNNYISVMMDGESPTGKDFMKQFRITSFPTFLYLNEKETHLYSTGGEFTAEEFISESKKALNSNTQLPYLERQFNDDIRNPESCLLYLNALRKSIDKDKTDDVVAKYLSTQPKDQIFTTINWKIIAFGVNNLNTKEFDFVMNHQSDFAKVSSTKRVEVKIVSVVNQSLMHDMGKLDSIGYFKNRDIAKKSNLTKVDSLVFKYDLQMYEACKCWNKYKQTTFESVQKWAWNDYKTINEISKIYIQHINEKEALQSSITWAKHSVESNDSAESNFLLARLYNKVKDKKTAITYARKTKNITTAMGWDTKEIDQFYLDLGIK